MTSNTIPYAEHVDDATKARIQALVDQNLSEEALWSLLGESLGLAATGEDPEEAGKKLFARRLKEVRNAVCNDKRIQAFMNSDTAAIYTDLVIMTTGKLLGDSYGGADTPVTACLITRLGLLKICDPNWEP